jgi:phenylpyruvate tautomerase PptA (4-oxalocrotonate tautomerase family)
MPWINLTLRRGALSKTTQHSLMNELTNTLMWWEKVPDTPRARRNMKGWIYEVDEQADYVGGKPAHERPSYFIELRIPAGRFDLLMKQGLQRDFTRIVLDHEGLNDPSAVDARRVWITIVEPRPEDWSIGGHTDWLRDYTSALDEMGRPRSRKQLEVSGGDQ